MMKKEELKQLALRIGNVPAGYESNVEEYQEDEVLFWWEDKNDPEADQYFRVQYDEPDDEGENVGLTYKACSGGVDLRFGEGRICVSKKTGLVTFYMPPEIDPKELDHIDPVPSLTMEEAKDAIRRNIKAELAWDRCYDDDSGRNVYRLVYKPVFPRFIEAHTGEAIMSLIG